MRGRRNDGAERQVNVGGKTWEEIAADLGISSARVQQIYRRAMEKMQRAVATDNKLRREVAEVLGFHLDD